MTRPAARGTLRPGSAS